MIRPARALAAVVVSLAVLFVAAGPAAGTPNTFKTKCSFLNSGQFDPIVHPGQFPAGHIHEFFGSTNITPSATGFSLQAAGSGTDSCADRFDTAGYWAPELFADGQPVQATGIDAYYERILSLHVAPNDNCPAFIEGCDGQAITSVVVPPIDMRLIAGNSAATGLQNISIIKWACSDNSTTGTLPPACPSKPLTVHIVFPSCWDGQTDRLANNTDNVTYPKVNGGVSTCPSGFDVQIPRVALTVHYNLYPDQPACSTSRASNCVNYAISAFDEATQQLVLGPPFTMHADWLNGWQTDRSLGAANPASFDELIARCNNNPDGGTACGVVSTTPPGSAFVNFG
jgi:Domain of unknown function (DUF1996)